MNSIKKVGEKYILTCEDGSVFDCELWFEKKTNAWHVKLPKNNPSGRTYVRKSIVDGCKDQTYEFPTKTVFRSGLTSGGWRSRLTKEELEELKSYEDGIERLKKVGLSRKPKSETDKLKDQIKKLEEELEELKSLRELREKSEK